MDWMHKESVAVQEVEVLLPCRPCSPRQREREKSKEKKTAEFGSRADKEVRKQGGAEE